MALAKAIEDGEEELACTLVYDGAADHDGDRFLTAAVKARFVMLTMVLILKTGCGSSNLLVLAVPDGISAGKPCIPLIRVLLKTGPSYLHVARALRNLFTWVRGRPLGPSPEYYEVLRLLIEYNPVVAAKGHGSFTPLFELNTVHDRETLDVLVWAGADLEDTLGGDTALARYCGGDWGIGRGPPPQFTDYSARLDVVQGFVTHGAKIDAYTHSGVTPLYEYVETHDTVVDARMAEIVDVLLRAGADETVVDSDGITAADMLNADTHPLTYKLLVNARIDRRWRRRGLLVMCIARHGRGFLRVKPMAVSRNKWSRVAKRLVKMGTDAGEQGVFRTIIGFL